MHTADDRSHQRGPAGGCGWRRRHDRLLSPSYLEPLPRLTDAEPKQQIVLEAARHGIAIYSSHTALDAAQGGINDWIAEGLGDGDIRALEPAPTLPASEQCKLVTFCPADAVDRLRSALATVGAGRIGDYELCSFELTGTGTFLGGSTTNPAVGRRGALDPFAVACFQIKFIKMIPVNFLNVSAAQNIYFDAVFYRFAPFTFDDFALARSQGLKKVVEAFISAVKPVIL